MVLDMRRNPVVTATAARSRAPLVAVPPQDVFCPVNIITANNDPCRHQPGTHSSGLPPSATICSRSFSLRATIDLGSLPRAVLPLSSLKLRRCGGRRVRAGSRKRD